MQHGTGVFAIHMLEYQATIHSEVPHDEINCLTLSAEKQNLQCLVFWTNTMMATSFEFGQHKINQKIMFYSKGIFPFRQSASSKQWFRSYKIFNWFCFSQVSIISGLTLMPLERNKIKLANNKILAVCAFCTRIQMSTRMQVRVQFSSVGWRVEPLRSTIDLHLP